MERNYNDGKRDGKEVWYYKNGQISYEGNYKDGKKFGKWTYFNEDGSLKKVEEF